MAIDYQSAKKGAYIDRGNDVLNGIAYNEWTQTWFVTGKRWRKVFEIEFIQ